jgi:hypothetical protein
MKVILLALSSLAFLVVLIIHAAAAINHNTFIMGGEYIVHEGEIVHGNLELVFAQVTLEEGSHIEGGVLSFSSAFDVCGTVAGNISSLESDVQLEKSARVKAMPRDKGVFPFVILLPEMVRWNPSFRG